MMRVAMARLAVSVLAVVLGVSPLKAQPAGDSPLKNPAFANDTIGKAPSGWTLAPESAPAKVVADETSPTKRALMMGPPAQGSMYIGQLVDAKPFRGKRVVLRLTARLSPGGSRKELPDDARIKIWANTSRENGHLGQFEFAYERPLGGRRAKEYRTSVLTGMIDTDAVMINVSAMLEGNATAYIAEFSFESMDGALRADAPAAALSGRGVKNLAALAKLYGYVRFFHPTDEVKEVRNWDSFMTACVEQVEGVKDSAELAAALTELFAPVAQSVQIWSGDEKDGPAPFVPSKDAKLYTVWRHDGVGGLMEEDPSEVYSSKRMQYPVKQPGDGGAPMGAAVVKNLGGGVWCRVPLTLELDAQMRTMPIATGEPAEPKRPDWWNASGDDRAARIAGVIMAWNVFQHFYPYFDVVDVDWPGVLTASMKQAAIDENRYAFYDTLKRMVGELEDGHGSVTLPGYVWPQPLNILFDWVGDRLIVVKAGEGVEKIKPGDEVVAIRGTPTAEWYAELRQRVSASTEGLARARVLWETPSFGMKNEPVEMTFRRAGSVGEEFTVTVPRTSDYASLKEARPANGSEVAPGIVYFDLNGADDPALRAAMPAISRADGVIFDLRGYPGDAAVRVLRHLTGEPIQSAKWQIGLARFPDQENIEWRNTGRWRLTPLEPRLGSGKQKVVFITNGRAISYAESCMGIVEAYKLGEIVGEPTAGTNGNVNRFHVCGTYIIGWTGMRVIKHDDSQHHGVGIRPTIPKSRTVEGIAAGRDELLETAIKAASAMAKPETQP